MIQTIDFNDFHRAFIDYGRGEQFTYDGLKALFEHMEAYEDEIGEPQTLDVIALCCEFIEYENLKAFQIDYGDEYGDMDAISYMTTVLPVNGDSFIILQY